MRQPSSNTRDCGWTWEINLNSFHDFVVLYDNYLRGSRLWNARYVALHESSCFIFSLWYGWCSPMFVASFATRPTILLLNHLNWTHRTDTFSSSEISWPPRNSHGWFACYRLSKMFASVNELHKSGYIHRDLKPGVRIWVTSLIKQIFDAHVRRTSLLMGLVMSNSQISDYQSIEP